jgi:nitronate monooxygenase
VLAERVPVVSFSWGTDAELIGRARAAGAFVLVQVSDSEEAKAVAAAGASGVIAQGVEAGGAPCSHCQSSPQAESLTPLALNTR